MWRLRVLRTLDRVSTVNWLARLPRSAAGVGLGVVFALVLAGNAIRLAAARDNWVFDFCVGIVACVIALLRERGRARAALAGLAVAALAIVIAPLGHLPGEPGLATVLALLVLGGSAVRALPPWLCAAVAAGGISIMAAGWYTADPADGSRPAPVQIGVMGWMAAIGCGLGLRVLDARRKSVTESIRRDERVALARELHDVVAHHVTGIVLQTQAARLVGPKDPGRLDATLAGIETAGTDALAAMRRVISLLRDADDGSTTAPRPEQLAELVQRFDGHGPAVRLDVAADEAQWPPEVTTTVYRVVQESLTNIARHAAHARSATVSVAQDEKSVTVEITDDAPPGPSRFPHRGGHGLIGMRERVEALGGTLDVGPEPGVGWSVQARLPVTAGGRA